MTVVGLVDDAVHALLRHPVRSTVTGLGVLLGVLALVAPLGLASAASRQVLDTIDASDSIGVAAVAPTHADEVVLPPDAVSRVRSQSWVRDAVRTRLVPDVPVSRPAVGGTAPDVVRLPVRTTDGGPVASVLGGRIAAGRDVDGGHVERGDAVAVVGVAVLDLLDLPSPDQRPTLLVGDREVTVVGVLRDSELPEWTSAVVVPDTWATTALPEAVTDEVLFRVVGRERDVAAEHLARALDVADPARIAVTLPPDATRVRRALSATLEQLVVGLGAVTLVVSVLGIASAVSTSVHERTREIGVRRAHGATRGEIGVQFLVEATVVGLVAGSLGSVLSTLVVLGVSAAMGWTPWVSWPLALLAPLVGTAVGAAAGVVPARRASAVEPVTALRGVA